MLKILVAEDDKYLGNAYRVKLAKAGFDVKIALDGQEALGSLKTFTPDLIILDVVMPKKDGFATLEELKKNPQWEHIPVIIASNLGQKEDLERGLTLGANDFIVKSELSLNNLIEKVKALLQDKENKA
ncbi:MAG: response regulator [Candidatus Levybacteria bacterium]|nr:response regulator [Candidatus Levybacteria bacterium]